MTARIVLFGQLAVVATAAAVLSFSALRDLALLCGFAAELAWLLPVVVDAGAAAGSLVWLGGRTHHLARRFASALALTLLGLSVGANALAHGLEAYRLAPAWWVVVAVSAIAPAVLGAVVHLAVLVGRATPAEAHGGLDRATELIAAGVGRRRLARELDISEHEARQLLTQARTPDSSDFAARRNGHAIPVPGGTP